MPTPIHFKIVRCQGVVVSGTVFFWDLLLLTIPIFSMPAGVLSWQSGLGINFHAPGCPVVQGAYSTIVLAGISATEGKFEPVKRQI